MLYNRQPVDFAPSNKMNVSYREFRALRFGRLKQNVRRLELGPPEFLIFALLCPTLIKTISENTLFLEKVARKPIRNYE
jgi:hypothetical protein